MARSLSHFGDDQYGPPDASGNLGPAPQNGPPASAFTPPAWEHFPEPLGIPLIGWAAIVFVGWHLWHAK